MKKNLLLYCLPFLIAACTQPYFETSDALKKGEDVQFDLDFTYTTKDNFEYEGKDYVAYADFRTDKEIQLFDLDGNEIYSLSVKELMKEEHQGFVAMAFSSLDTIALLTRNTNKVYVINKKGEILYQKDYSSLLPQVAQLQSPLYIKDNELRTGVKYFDRTWPSKPTKKEYITMGVNMKSYYRLLVDPVSNEEAAEPSLQMDSMYTRFVKWEDVGNEKVSVLTKDSINVFYSAYSDSLYIFDLDGNLNNIVEVKSENVETKVTPVSWLEFWEDSKSIKKNWQKSSYITKLFWDQYRKRYYCIVRDKKIGDKLPFYIFIYDNNFNKIDEVKLNYEKYWPILLIGKKGLYVHKNEWDSNTQKFTIFNYEGDEKE